MAAVRLFSLQPRGSRRRWAVTVTPRARVLVQGPQHHPSQQAGTITHTVVQFHYYDWMQGEENQLCGLQESSPSIGLAQLILFLYPNGVHSPGSFLHCALVWSPTDSSPVVPLRQGELRFHSVSEYYLFIPHDGISVYNAIIQVCFGLIPHLHLPWLK